MRRTRPLEVSEEDRTLLLSWLGSPRLSERIRLRARIVVASAGGQGARALARDLRVSLETIYLWRRRYAEQGIDGLRSLSSPGRHSQVDRRADGADPARGSSSAPRREDPVSRGRRARQRRQPRDGAPAVGSARHPRPIAPPSDEDAPPRRARSVQHHRDLHRPAVAGPRPGGADGRAAGRARPARTAFFSPLRACVRGERALDRARSIWQRRRASRNGKRGGLGQAEGSPGGPVQDRRRRRAGDPRWSAASPDRKRGHRRTRGSGRLNPPGSRADPRRLAHPRHRLVARRLLGDQEEALAGVFGHLMDYFASWRDGSAPFIWTPGPPPSPPLRTA